MLYADPFLTVYCCLLAALLGACMGSFLNCASLAHRPWGERARVAGPTATPAAMC
ncbi:MAG: hypothetical protein ACLU38_15305 [Dysosmobacter sp.]